MLYIACLRQNVKVSILLVLVWTPHCLGWYSFWMTATNERVCLPKGSIRTFIVTLPLVTFRILKPTVGIMSSLNWPDCGDKEKKSTVKTIGKGSLKSASNKMPSDAEIPENRSKGRQKPTKISRISSHSFQEDNICSQETQWARITCEAQNHGLGRIREGHTYWITCNDYNMVCNLKSKHGRRSQAS